MTRTKQAPLQNAHQRKLKQFFVEAVSSTPDKCSSDDSSSSKKSSSPQKASSSKSQSQGSSTQKSSSENAGGNERRAPGVAALSEIRRLQRSTHLLIPRAAFIRLVRDVLLAEEQRQKGLEDGFTLQGMRIAAEALECLQEAAEAQLTNFFTMSYYCTLHAGRKTLMVRDCRLARLLLGRNHPLNP